LEIGVSCPRVMRVNDQGNYIIGDEEGTVWHVKENGLTLNKVKVFDSPVSGIEYMSGNKIMAYGANLAILNI